MNRLMTKLLNLPGVIVEDSQETEDTLILFVKSEKKTAACPRCSRISRRLHQNQRYLVKDLPLGNREVVLSVNRRRFKCENCRKPFSECLDFVTRKKSFTHRYAQSITQQVVHNRTTNGIVEGINNKLKLLKPCGFGFRNFHNFELRALLFWHFSHNLAQ